VLVIDEPRREVMVRGQAADLTHVFDRFWRGRQAAQTSGSGIGLSVAADLARAHGGQLTAASQPGHGTTMTLTCPAPDLDPPSQRGPP
jgi:two-component system sensor histidine kinase BaeS